jgi:hypothetical protein
VSGGRGDGKEGGEAVGRDPADIVDRYPQLDDCVDPDDPDYLAKSIGCVAVLKQHAEETMRVLETMIARKSGDLARHQLPPHSLLPLWIAERGTAPPTETDEPGESAATRECYGVPVDEPRSLFMRAGTVWLVRFRDEIDHIQHYRGMTQLAHLLENPTKWLDVIALARCEAAPAPEGVRPPGMASGIGGTLGVVLDVEAIKRLEHHLRNLPAAIQAARAAGRSEEVKRLLEDRRAARKALREAKGLGGRPRQVTGPEERARKAVSKNINACYELFAVNLSKFVDHAHDFVNLGVPPYYHPDPPERWRVER